ncbi:MAG: hypothetical protein ABI867_41825 [Kofleriaceae bacterium]
MTIEMEISMPRKPRVIEPGNIYHLISRFVAGEWFIRSPQQRRWYLRLLGNALLGSDWRCFSYAIMSNHIHLGVVAGFSSLASWIRDVHGEFAEDINEQRGRIGSVFVRGPKSRAVRPDGVATLIGYIHQNPVRAGVVEHPVDSDWTSHPVYMGRAERPLWLDMELGLALTDFRDGEALDHWMAATPLVREQMQQALVEPRSAGRPRIVPRQLQPAVRQSDWTEDCTERVASQGNTSGCTVPAAQSNTSEDRTVPAVQRDALAA